MGTKTIGEVNAANVAASATAEKAFKGMLTRRSFVSSGLAIAAGGVIGSAATSLTSCTHRVRGVGGFPTGAAEITGSASLRAHAAAHGLLTGVAVAIPVLRSDPVYARTLSEQYSIL